MRSKTCTSREASTTRYSFLYSKCFKWEATWVTAFRSSSPFIPFLLFFLSYFLSFLFFFNCAFVRAHSRVCLYVCICVCGWIHAYVERWLFVYVYPTCAFVSEILPDYIKIFMREKGSSSQWYLPHVIDPWTFNILPAVWLRAAMLIPARTCAC